MTRRLSTTVSGEADVALVEDALEAAADELDAELVTTPGHPAAGEISRSDAIVELARAYLGAPRRVEA